MPNSRASGARLGCASSDHAGIGCADAHDPNTGARAGLATSANIGTASSSFDPADYPSSCVDPVVVDVS